MIYSEVSAISMAQAHANNTNKPINIYVRKNGEYSIIAPENLGTFRQMLNMTESLTLVTTVSPIRQVD